MSDKPKKITIDPSEIPIESSLGLLAIGDVAFTAWRDIKKKHKVNDEGVHSVKNENE